MNLFPAAHRSAVLHHHYCCSEAFFRSLQQHYHEKESALQPRALSSPRTTRQETLKNYRAEGGTIQAVFLGHSRDPLSSLARRWSSGRSQAGLPVV